MDYNARMKRKFGRLPTKIFGKDVHLFLGHAIEKYNYETIVANGPSIKDYSDAVNGLLGYKKWLRKENAVGEVLASVERVGQVLTKLKQKFPRSKGTKKWNMQTNAWSF